MSELIDLCNKILSEENKTIDNIKIEYSYTQKILLIFTNYFLYKIDNSKEKPNLLSRLKLNFSIKHTSIHPGNQNQLIITTTKDDSILIIPDIKNFSKMDEILKVNIKTKNIISIKFSYFSNFFGVLHDKNKFKLFYIKQNKEEMILSEELDTNYIDFNFCPQFSSGFDMFMIFFMLKNGELNMYGPFFPPEFSIKKEYFFNMNNFLLYKLNTMKNNEFDYQKYAISLAIINDLHNSLINESKDYYTIKISEKVQKVNITFKKRNIFINNNFLTNNSNIIDINYKQIYILEKRPLTILRISENNNIDLIILSDEIFPELANVGNIVSNNELKINNYLIEFIQLYRDKKNEKKELLKIIQNENEQLFIQTDDSLFLVQIPYLNELKKAVDDNMMFLPNKIKKTSINKLFKYPNNRIPISNKYKIIEIKDILILPELKEFELFAILKEKNNEKEIKRIIVKSSSYGDVNIINNSTSFNDIFRQKKKINIDNDEFKVKLNEIDSIRNDIINHKIIFEEKLLENKKGGHNFEQKLNEDMKNLYKIYNNLLKEKEELFLKKINIMKNIYNNLSNSKIKEDIDETNKKIISLKTLKEKITKNNEIISQKIININEKINNYELTDEETENYLKILSKSQKEMRDRLSDIERKIKFCEESIKKNYLFNDLFPKNDLDFNLIEKENQTKYMKMEEEINTKSKELYIEEPK